MGYSLTKIKNFLLNREEIFFYALLFLLPLQIRKIIYFPGWYFNEWLAVSLYLTDLLLIILFVSWIVRAYSLKLKAYSLPPSDYFLLLFILFSGLSIIVSEVKYLSFFHLIKLVEFSLFYFYLKNYALKKFNLISSALFLISGAVTQSFIGIFQFARQSDLGLRFLGESLLSPNLNGVAVFINSSGERILRAYGSVPHPNILAVYLFLSIFIFVLVWVKFAEKIKNNSDVRYFFIIYGVLLSAFILTFSRAVIAFAVLGFAFFTVFIFLRRRLRNEFTSRKNIKTGFYYILFGTIIVALFFSFAFGSEIKNRLKISQEDEAVRLRAFYNQEAFGGKISLFGTGAGTFVHSLMREEPNLPRDLYQPVHNIYLLLYSEVGLLGLLAFLIFIFLSLKEFIAGTGLTNIKHHYLFFGFIAILLMAGFDHLFFSLQQGRFVFWIFLSLLTLDV